MARSLRKRVAPAYTPPSIHETTCRKCRAQFMTRRTGKALCPACWKQARFEGERRTSRTAMTPTGSEIPIRTTGKSSRRP